MRGLRHQPNRSRARCTGHRHGPGSHEQARASSRPGGPQLRLQPEATAVAAAPGDTPAPSEREGWPGCSSRSRGQGATAAGANMRSRQVKLEVLARELRLGELEELLRRPLVGEDSLEHQVRQQPILRARALLLFPAVAVRSFWAEAAAAHRRSGGGCRGLCRSCRSVERQTCSRVSDRGLQPVCTPPFSLPGLGGRPLEFRLPPDERPARMPRGTIRGILALSAGGTALWWQASPTDLTEPALPQAAELPQPLPAAPSPLLSSGDGATLPLSPKELSRRLPRRLPRRWLGIGTGDLQPSC